MKRSRTTITDIANELGISPSTVSRALNNHPAISDKTRKAVVKLARKKNYQPNLLALHLLQKKTNTIGVIVPEITSYFFSSIINGIQDYVNSLGVNMIIGQSNESYAEEKKILQTFTSINVDGFLVSPSSEKRRSEHLELLAASHIPLVIFDRDCEDLEVDKVFVEEYSGAFQAVEYLIRTGCRRIAHIGGTQTLSTARHRLRAYKDAQPPDALFTINDGVAIGAMYVIKDAGIQIPEEISVIGFDDDPHSAYFKPSLSTVWQPTYEMGMLAARMLMKRINSRNELLNQKTETLFPELVIRGSSRQTPDLFS